jgi:hypothetical protein
VLETVERIRADKGPKAAAAYHRTVAEEWGRKRAADLLTEELARGIGDMP